MADRVRHDKTSLVVILSQSPKTANKAIAELIEASKIARLRLTLFGFTPLFHVIAAPEPQSPFKKRQFQGDGGSSPP